MKAPRHQRVSTAGNGKLPEAPFHEEQQRQQKAEANQPKLLIEQQRADAERKCSFLAPHSWGVSP